MQEFTRSSNKNNYLRKKEEIALTDEEKSFHRKQEVCHIYKKKSVLS